MDILIIVTPTGNGTRGPRYRAEWMGVPVANSRTPFFAAARTLLAQGLPPDATLVMRHAGSQIDSIRQRLGRAAALTISEPDKGRVRATRWTPHEANVTKGA